jgi:hypothetical protein
MTTMIEAQDKMDKRLEVIEKYQLEMQAEKEAKEKIDKKQKWYETKIGEWLIKMGTLIIMFIIGAAIGQNMLPAVSKIIK